MFPNNVAFPFGGGDSHEYVVIELHYDNPHEIEGMNQYMTCIYIILLCYKPAFSLFFYDAMNRHYFSVYILSVQLPQRKCNLLLSETRVFGVNHVCIQVLLTVLV